MIHVEPYLDYWCGYAAVTPDHPLHGIGDVTPILVPGETPPNPDNSPVIDYLMAMKNGELRKDGLVVAYLGNILHVHGGITWAKNHLPGQKPDGFWWLGFDTAHYNSGKWTEDMTRAEAERLAEQLAAWTTPVTIYEESENV